MNAMALRVTMAGSLAVPDSDHGAAGMQKPVAVRRPHAFASKALTLEGASDEEDTVGVRDLGSHNPYKGRQK